MLTLRRIRRNDQLTDLQRRIRPGQPLRQSPRSRHRLAALPPRLGCLRIRQIPIHGHTARPDPMPRHIPIRDVLDEIVPRLRDLPVHVARFRHEEVIVGREGVEGERLHPPARGEQFGEAFVVGFQAARVPGAVVADDDVASVDAELDPSRAPLPAVVAEHVLHVGREGGGHVVPAATVRAPGEEGAVGAQGDVERAIGEGGLVVVHPFEEGRVRAPEVLVVLAVVPDQEPGSVVAVRHVVGLGLDGFFLLVRHGPLHAAEDVAIFGRWGLRFRLVGVGVWKELFEFFGRVFGPSLVQRR